MELYSFIVSELFLNSEHLNETYEWILFGDHTTVLRHTSTSDSLL